MFSKKLLIAAALAGFSLIGVSSSADAALPGYYVGGQLGWGDTHMNSGVSDTGLAEGIFGGYQFNQNLAAELGYTHFKKATASGASGGIKEYAVTLLGKGIIPLDNGVSLYGKLGPAFVKTNASGDFSSQDTQSKIYPAFGVGVSYDVTPNVPVDLSWTRIQRMGSSNNIPSSDFLALGVAYNFG